jgi:hypothetical protein
MMIWALNRVVLEAPLAVIAGDVSQKQWTAGAPVIGAAPVPFRETKKALVRGISDGGAPRIFL